MNYFAYFSEVEERFLARRGSPLILSTLDWALIETWRDAGVPLAAVLRGIDDAFDKHDAKQAKARSRSAKVNGLAWCAQAVMQAAEQQVDAATGMAVAASATTQATGFETDRIGAFLRGNALALRAASVPPGAAAARDEGALRLEELAAAHAVDGDLASLDRTLTVVEERLVAALTHAVPEAEIVGLREAADRELAAFRSRMNAAQLRQVRDQFLLKRLMTAYALPRLSLFYMGHA